MSDGTYKADSGSVADSAISAAVFFWFRSPASVNSPDSGRSRRVGGSPDVAGAIALELRTLSASVFDQERLWVERW